MPYGLILCEALDCLSWAQRAPSLPGDQSSRVKSPAAPGSPDATCKPAEGGCHTPRVARLLAAVPRLPARAGANPRARRLFWSGLGGAVRQRTRVAAKLAWRAGKHCGVAPEMAPVGAGKEGPNAILNARSSHRQRSRPSGQRPVSYTVQRAAVCRSS